MRIPVRALRRAPLRAALAVAATLVVTASLLTTGAPAQAADPSSSRTSTVASTAQTNAAAQAPSAVTADLSKFQAGRIIDDAVFYNASTMTAAQIQNFFNGKVSQCRSGYTCLKDFRQNTVNKPGDAMCPGGYAGARNETAAQIIAKASKSCGINPQAIIVMLQKEQGLVTHVWPSDWRFDSALGQGCPDTAGCDANYQGFFAQIYGAAWQMKRYANPPGTSQFFTWYAPGNTWNVRFNPDAGCGTSPVKIQNKATAALYYYTPYQPNAAALRAGYGEGDGCSAYGNRNFYNYFTDWFGSVYANTKPTPPSDGLVKLADAAPIWLIAGGYRHHVTPEAYPQYKAVLGNFRTVSKAQLETLPTGASASLFVRNTADGVIAYLDKNQTHRFPDCDVLVLWGAPCAGESKNLPNLSGAQFAKFTKGAEVTRYGRLTSGGRIHQVTSSNLRPLFDAGVATALNGGRAPYAAVLPQAVSSQRPLAPRVGFRPGTFTLPAGSRDVWLLDGAGKRFHLPSWALAADIGMPTSVTARGASSADLAGYASAGKLSAFVTCNGRTWVGAGGRFSAYSGPVPSGFPVAALSADTCATLKLTGGSFSGKGVFVRFSDAAAVYHLVNGEYRHVQTHAQLNTLNGGPAPKILVSKPEARAAVKIGAPYPKPGTVLRAQGESQAWVVDSASLIALPSYALSAELGLGDTATEVPAAELADLEQRPPQTSFVACDGVEHVAAGGGLVGVDSTEGMESTTWGPELCADRVRGTVDGEIALTDGSATLVAVDGGYLQLTEEDAAQRASEDDHAAPLTVGAEYLSELPVTERPADGSVVGLADESEQMLVSAGRLIPVSDPGVAVDLGLASSEATVLPDSLASVLVQEHAPLSIIVRCDARTWIGAGGVLSPIPDDAVGALAVTDLSADAYGVLDLSGEALAADTQLRTPSGERFTLVDGALTPVPTDAPEAVRVLDIDEASVAALSPTP